MMNSERRKAKRRPILDTFSLFVVVPSKGPHRLPLNDVSELGVGFDLDTEGEDPSSFPIKAGDQLKIHLYINQSLYFPIDTQVARILEGKLIRKIGAHFVNQQSAGYLAFLSFLKMLDQIGDAARIEGTGA